MKKHPKVYEEKNRTERPREEALVLWVEPSHPIMRQASFVKLSHGILYQWWRGELELVCCVIALRYWGGA